MKSTSKIIQTAASSKSGFGGLFESPRMALFTTYPAGLGLFPLLDASQFQDELAADGYKNVDCIFPMYDREAKYLEFIASKYDFGLLYTQNPYAIRPCVGGINAISGITVQEQWSSVSPADLGIRVQMRQRGTSPPSVEQDYIVVDAAVLDIRP